MAGWHLRHGLIGLRRVRKTRLMTAITPATKVAGLYTQTCQLLNILYIAECFQYSLIDTSMEYSYEGQ